MRTRASMRTIAAVVLAGGLLCAAGHSQDTAGLQLWDADGWKTTSIGDHYGVNFEISKLKPISMAGCRNGVFSGSVIVTSSIAPIVELKATITELVAKGGAKIPKSAIRIRYADLANARHSWAPPYRFDRLLDEPPEEIGMVNMRSHRKWKPKRTGPIAMRPVWVTVRVPKDTPPGVYEGTLKISCEESKAPPLKVRIKVADWALPDPMDFRIQNVALQSQEAVAKHYGVEMWSDKHFELMGKSLKLLAEINSRQLAMNLCIDFYGMGGNEESMVRWIKQPDGTFKHDFTIFDKYLDLAAKTIGKPNMLRLNCWGEIARKTTKMIDCGKKISILDQSSGELSTMDQPMLGTEESYTFWKPVLDVALKKIKERGWLDVTATGQNSYCWGVAPKVVDVAHRIWPEGVWAYTGHNGSLGGRFKGTQKGVAMLCKYAEHIWGPGPGAKDPAARGYRTLLKKRPGYLFHTMRGQFRATSPLRTLRSIVERNITPGHDGVSDFGADFWPIPNPRKRGRFYCLGNGRGTGGPNCSTRALIAPGPEGAVATERFEAFREGLQVCETILYIQKGINSGKLPSALAGRANAMLDERGKLYKKAHVPSSKKGKTRFDPNIFAENAEQRENELFALAGEIAKVLKK